jgi:hypothetical protein
MYRPYLLAGAIGAVGLLVGVASSSVPLTSAFAAISACALGFAMGAAAVRRDRIDEPFAFPAAAVRRELNRARRYERHIALLRIKLPDFAATRTTEELQASVRETDVVWMDGSSTYLFLPDTDSPGASILAERLREALADLDGTTVTAAVFPDHGATFGALLQQLSPLTSDAALPEAAIESIAGRQLG